MARTDLPVQRRKELDFLDNFASGVINRAHKPIYAMGWCVVYEDQPAEVGWYGDSMESSRAVIEAMLENIKQAIILRDKHKDTDTGTIPLETALDDQESEPPVGQPAADENDTGFFYRDV